MKTLIAFAILFTSSTLFADTNDLFHQFKSQDKAKFEELKKFIDLVENEEIEFNKSKVDQKKVDQLKTELKTELLNDYINSLTKTLGPCLSSPCLSNKNSYDILNLQNRQGICFPDVDCEYYKCMEEKHQCMDEGYEYFENLAYPTCSNYVKRLGQNKFTQLGVDWIYRVMVCLQKGLVDECDKNGNCLPGKKDNKENCDYMTEFTLEFHPGCYINSGVGICQLPMTDQLAIWKTVQPYLTKREKKEAYKVMWHCLTKGGKTKK
jgi:hypothetical protein